VGCQRPALAGKAPSDALDNLHRMNNTAQAADIHPSRFAALWLKAVAHKPWGTWLYDRHTLS